MHFRLRTLLVATTLIAAVLLAVVLAPQFLSRQARLEVLRNHVDEVARLAASQVDGDLHRQLINGTFTDEDALATARAPLLHLHSNWPEAIYVYTMGVRNGVPFFVLDTAQDEQFAQQRGLRGSEYLEPFRLREEYASGWLEELAAGRSFVNGGFQLDDFGYFLSGHAPIRDRQGQIAGFAGVDFDLDYYLREESRFRRIEIVSVTCTFGLALLLGYLYARYRNAQQLEMQRHYESSMQDSLTGLPNRRGALAAIAELWSRHRNASCAALLVDIDNFKGINDTHGHAAGDAVIRALADALRSCVGEGDVAARLGGDEFLLFVSRCDEAGARDMAARLLAAVHAAAAPPSAFTVSIGISVTTGAMGGFDRLYREADAALYQAKHDGRDRFAMHLAE